MSKGVTFKLKQRRVFCFMENHITYHESVKEAIALALIQIMKNKLFSDITILEIVNKAGVSRSSFYRNFDDKEDVISYYIDSLFDESKKEENPYSPHHLETFLIEKFTLIKENKAFFLALKKNKILHLLYQQANKNTIKNIYSYNLNENNRYQSAFFSSASIGVIIEWIQNDLVESEEDMAHIFIDLLYGYMDNF